MDIRIRHYDALGMTYIDIYTDRSIECISFWGKLGFFGKTAVKREIKNCIVNNLPLSNIIDMLKAKGFDIATPKGEDAEENAKAGAAAGAYFLLSIAPTVITIIIIVLLVKSCS